jgi:hypothetical protein
MPDEFNDGECGSESDPDRGPSHRLAERDSRGTAIHHAHIQRQHGDDKKVEENPENEHR